LFESEFLEDTTGRDILIVNVGQELAQGGFRKCLLDEYPHGSRCDPSALVSLRDSITDFCVTHRVADVLQRDVPYQLAIIFNKPTVTLVMPKIRQVRAF